MRKSRDAPWRRDSNEMASGKPGAVQIVLGFQLFIASTQIEETKLSHAKLLRSEPARFESDLRNGWKREFFEVPERRSTPRRRDKKKWAPYALN